MNPEEVLALQPFIDSGEPLHAPGPGQRALKDLAITFHAEAVHRAALDPLRQMLRLIRFMAQYGWEPDPATEAALVASAPYLAELHRDTVERELQKWQKRGILDDGLVLLREFDMLQPLRQAAKNLREG